MTGWREPHGVLLIYKNQQEDENGFYNERIYVRERDAYREMWDGKRKGLEGALKMGFDRVLSKGETTLKSLARAREVMKKTTANYLVAQAHYNLLKRKAVAALEGDSDEDDTYKFDDLQERLDKVRNKH